MLEADRIGRICNNGLERYEQIMHPYFYEQYKNTWAWTRIPSWYSAKVPLDAIAYLIALRDVKIAIQDVTAQGKRMEKNGKPWTKEQMEAKLAEAVKRALGPATTKATKSLPALNPAYGNLIGKCSQLYAQTTKWKREKADGNVLALTPVLSSSVHCSEHGCGSADCPCQSALSGKEAEGVVPPRFV
jgi:hypothetical protein